MKAVATALVLIAGAAVVLWYGNTLNSWVLGGLIGGFAALLLSIPISLMLFSYFAHRYDEYQQEHIPASEKASFVQHEPYALIHDQPYYDGEEDYLDYKEDYSEYDEEVIYNKELDFDQERSLLAEQTMWKEESSHRLSSVRHLPLPSATHVPKASQAFPSSLRHDLDQRDHELQQVQRRKARPRSGNSSGIASYQRDASHSRYRWEALRAARIEAALQCECDDSRHQTVVQRIEGPRIPRRARSFNASSGDNS